LDFQKGGTSVMVPSLITSSGQVQLLPCGGLSELAIMGTIRRDLAKIGL